MVGLVLAMLAVFGVVGVVSAQGQNPPEGAPAYGYVHDYLIGYAAEVLDLDVEIIEARLDGGETLAEIVFAAGIEDFTTFMQDARSYVSEQLAADGIEIPGWTNGQGWNRNRMQQSKNFGSCLGMGEEGNQIQQMGRGFRGGRK